MNAQPLSLGPFAGARVALLVVNLLGDTKGEYCLTASLLPLTRHVIVPATLTQWCTCLTPPTRVSVVHTPTARIQRDGVGPVRFYSLI